MKVKFSIPGKTQIIDIDIIPRLNEHVTIWKNRWIVFDVTHYVKENYISIGLYPSKD